MRRQTKGKQAVDLCLSSPCKPKSRGGGGEIPETGRITAIHTWGGCIKRKVPPGPMKQQEGQWLLMTLLWWVRDSGVLTCRDEGSMTLTQRCYRRGRSQTEDPDET